MWALEEEFDDEWDAGPCLTVWNWNKQNVPSLSKQLLTGKAEKCQQFEQRGEMK